MQVILDASPLGSGRGGDETYLRGIIDGLACTEGDGTTFPTVLPRDQPVPEPIRSRPEFPVVRVPRRPGAWHFGVTLPVAARQWGQIDLVLSVTHSAPATWRLPTALNVGDLSFLHRPQDYPRGVRMRLNTLIPRQVQYARAVIAPSEFSRADIIDSYDVDPHRVHVVPACVEPWQSLTEEETEQATEWLAAAGVRSPYLLYLGNLHPRKNVERLVEAYSVARSANANVAEHQLVIAGRRWWGAGQAAERPAAGVLRLGQVSDVVRRHLLEHATALAYLSLFEGFGLPPLEAMSASTPVLGSDIPALREVCGDAAVLVDPFDIDAIADGLTRLVESASLRDELRKRGLRRCAQYDVKNTGRCARAAFRDGVRRSL